MLRVGKMLLQFYYLYHKGVLGFIDRDSFIPSSVVIEVLLPSEFFLYTQNLGAIQFIHSERINPNV